MKPADTRNITVETQSSSGVETEDAVETNRVQTEDTSKVRTEDIVDPSGVQIEESSKVETEDAIGVITEDRNALINGVVTEDTVKNSTDEIEDTVIPEDTVNTSKVKHDNPEDLWSILMPEELLLLIFQEGAHRYGPVPYLCRVARVCRRWHQLSYHPSLWTEVDLSIGWITRDMTGLQMLCETRLHRTQSLDLTAWFGMTDQALQCILEYCDQLHTLRLAHCEKLTPEAIGLVVDSPITLKELDISFMSPTVSNHKCLRRLVQGLGPHLRTLNLSNNCIDDQFGRVLDDIAVHCTQLRRLDLSHLSDFLMTVSMILVNIEALQRGCPDLEWLLMTKSLFKARPATEQAKAFSPGFPKLKHFSAPTKISDDFLQRVLKSSFGLEKLKIKLEQSGNVNYTSPPITDLRSLIIHKAKPQHLQVRWHHSLVYLDLSWVMLPGSCQAMDTAMRNIFSPTGPIFVVLQTILLCGCAVSANGVRPIFDCCPKLNHLNLNFCSMLPYGWSRDYQGPELAIFKHIMVGLPSIQQPVDHHHNPEHQQNDQQLR